MQGLVLRKAITCNITRRATVFARNKQRREFCTLLGSDTYILSMDDMAKIKVGAPVVSGYPS